MDAVRSWLERSERLMAEARRAAMRAAAVTPNSSGWLALAEAEYDRTRGAAHPDLWAEAATTWEQLQRPPLTAYCRWREAETLVATGASRTEAGVPLRDAYTIATRIGANPMLRELELLAQRSRLDLAQQKLEPSDGDLDLEKTLGLTPREGEVLRFVARGYTDREIAAALTISVKTTSVHVSHILRKLDAPNRRAAAAIAHRFGPPPLTQPLPDL
jgi:DNA-binding CsgD family transcriptional regulator